MNQGKGAHHLSMRMGGAPAPWARPLPRGPPVASPTPTPPPYIEFRVENKREDFITFYDTEPPPSPKTPREG